MKKSPLSLLGAPAATALLLLMAAAPAPAAPAPQDLPLENGSFALPPIGTEPFRNYATPQGWTANNEAARGDRTHGGPGLSSGYGSGGKGQNFFWNAPLGTLRQAVPAAKYVVGAAGDLFKLSYRYRFGKGNAVLCASPMIGGLSVASKKLDLAAPCDWRDEELYYTAAAADAGKPLGVEFQMQQVGDTFSQIGLAEVKVQVTSNQATGVTLHDGSPTDTYLRFIGRWDRRDPAQLQSNWGALTCAPGSRARPWPSPAVPRRAAPISW